MLAKHPLPARAGLFTVLMLTLAACNFGAPPPVSQVASPQTSYGVSEFISSNTVANAQAALFTRGLTSSATITLNGKTVLSSGASLHGNGGYTLNGNITVSGTVSASSGATVCVDNARLNACVNGKPKTLIAPITVPTPSYNGFMEDYKPSSFDKTLEGNQSINSAAELSSKFPKGSTVWVKGNLAVNSTLKLEDVTLFLDGNLNVNVGVDFKNSVVLAQQIGINGSSSTLEDSVVVAAKDLNLNSALTSSGQSTLFAAQDLSLNAKFSSSGQLALIAKSNLRLNSGSQPNAKAILWSGGLIDLNGSSTLEGGVLAAGTIRVNGSLELSKGAEVRNPDLPGYRFTPSTSSETRTGSISPGQAVEGPDGVRLIAPSSTQGTGSTVSIERTSISPTDYLIPNLYEQLGDVYRIHTSQAISSNTNDPFQIIFPKRGIGRGNKLVLLSLEASSVKYGFPRRLNSPKSPQRRYSVGPAFGQKREQNRLRARFVTLWPENDLLYVVARARDLKNPLPNSSPLSLSAQSEAQLTFDVSCGFASGEVDVFPCQANVRTSAKKFAEENYADFSTTMRLESRGTLPRVSPTVYLVPREFRNTQGDLVQPGGKCTNEPDTLAFYNPSTEAFTVCLEGPDGTVGNLDFLDKVIRHELFHAVQKGINPSLFPLLLVDSLFGPKDTDWIIEGTATAVMYSKPSLSIYNDFLPLTITTALDKVVFPYEAQDFWVFAGSAKGVSYDYLYQVIKLSPFLSNINSAFSSSSFPFVSPTLAFYNLGLREAYWRFVKNQAIESSTPLRSEIPCRLSDTSFDLGKTPEALKISLDYKNMTRVTPDFPLGRLTARAILVSFQGATKGKVKINLEGDGALYKIYPFKNGKFVCSGDDGDFRGEVVKDIDAQTKLLIVGAQSYEGSAGPLWFERGQLDGPTPSTLSFEPKNGQPDTKTFSFNNKGKAPLDYKMVFEPVGNADSIASVQLSGAALEGTIAEADPTAPPPTIMSLEAKCLRSNPDPVRFTVNLKDPGAVGEPVMGKVELSVTCRGGLSLVKPADNVSMMVDESRTSNFAVKNEGDGPSVYTAITPNSSNSVATLSPAQSGGTITGQGIENLSRTITCTWVGGTAFSVDITPQDGSDPVSTSIGVSCTPPPCPDLRFHAFEECFPDNNFGDPHIRTRDGLDYNFQAVGEFIFARSSVANMPLEYQVRYKPVGNSGSFASAASVRVGSDRVAVYSRSSNTLEVKFNGQTLVPDAGGRISQALSDNGKLLYNDRLKEGYIYWNDGSNLFFRNLSPLGGHLNLSLNLHGRHRQQTVGLSGNFNGNPADDVQLRNGTVLPNPPSFAQLYGEFGNDWRVSQTESLFDYAAGESTETFTDRNFPPAPRIITAAERARAEAVCRAAGIVDPSILEGCIYDVTVTGDDSLAGSAAQSDPNADTIALDRSSMVLTKGASTVLNAILPRGRQGVEVLWSASAGRFERISNSSVRYIAPDTAGDYTVTARVQGGNASSSAMVKVVDQRLSGETRFFVSWGGAPRDLDTHLWLPASSPYHVYYGRRGGDQACPYAQLDQDITSGFGPEIMRVKRLTGLTGTYQLWVYNYSNTPSFISSETKVEVKNEDGSTLATIPMLQNPGEGLWWHVLDFDAASGQLNIVNTVGDLTEPYADTDSGCANFGGQSLRSSSVSPSFKPAWPMGIPFQNR